jgi:hypothetical protein
MSGLLLANTLWGWVDFDWAEDLDSRRSHTGYERECCLLVLNLVSSTLPCIRQPGPRFRVLDVCGFV